MASDCAICTGNSINCWHELLVDRMYICLCVSQVHWCCYRISWCNSFAEL